MTLAPIVYDYRRAAGYALVAYLLAAFGMVFFKLVIGGYPVPQVILGECAFVMPCFLILAMVQGGGLVGMRRLRTHYPIKQLCRGVLQLVAAYTGMYALRLMPLPTSTMLSYATPFFAVIAGIFFLKERVSGKSWLLVVAGFVGVALVAQPEGATLEGVALQMLSCLFISSQIMLMKTMPKDTNITFSFYTVLVCGMASLILTLWNGMQPFSVQDLFYIAMAGITSFFGAQFMFASYRLAPLHFAMPFQYTELIWVSLIGYVIWSDVPTMVQIMGVAIIAVTSLYMAIKGRQIDEPV